MSKSILIIESTYIFNQDLSYSHSCNKAPFFYLLKDKEFNFFKNDSKESHEDFYIKKMNELIGLDHFDSDDFLETANTFSFNNECFSVFIITLNYYDFQQINNNNHLIGYPIISNNNNIIKGLEPLERYAYFHYLKAMRFNHLRGSNRFTFPEIYKNNKDFQFSYITKKNEDFQFSYNFNENELLIEKNKNKLTKEDLTYLFSIFNIEIINELEPYNIKDFSYKIENDINKKLILEFTIFHYFFASFLDASPYLYFEHKSLLDQLFYSSYDDEKISNIINDINDFDLRSADENSFMDLVDLNYLI